MSTVNTRITEFIRKYGLPLVILLASLSRIYLLILNDYVIADDGILYIWQAENIANNGITALNPEIFNPFPVAIAICHWLLNLVSSVSFETAALMITSLCGLFLLYPLYKLTDRYFGAVPAFISCLYVGLLPELTEVSCSVLRGAPALCLITWAFYLYITAIRPPDPMHWRLGRLIGAGGLVVLAGMIRLELFIFFGAFGLTLLLAHTWPIKPYRLIRRLTAGVALIIVFVIFGILGLSALRVKTGTWSAGPFGRIFQQHGLAEIKVKEDPFAVNKDLLYGPDGKIRPHVLVKFKFQHLAYDHRRVLYIFEVLYKFWKAFLPVGLVLVAAGIWLIVRRRMLGPTDPLGICCLLLCGIIIGVYYRYASTHYYIATRHVLGLVIPLSVFVGVPILYIPGMSRLGKLAAAGLAIAGLSMLCYKTFQPIRLRKLPMKESGLRLAKHLPEDAILFTASTQKQVPFYAHAEYRMFTPQHPTQLYARLVKTPNRYLVLNMNDSWQAEYAAMTTILTRVELELAKGRKYDFSLYRARGREQE